VVFRISLLFSKKHFVCKINALNVTDCERLVYLFIRQNFTKQN